MKGIGCKFLEQEEILAEMLAFLTVASAHAAFRTGFSLSEVRSAVSLGASITRTGLATNVSRKSSELPRLASRSGGLETGSGGVGIPGGEIGVVSLVLAFGDGVLLDGSILCNGVLSASGFGDGERMVLGVGVGMSSATARSPSKGGRSIADFDF